MRDARVGVNASLNAATSSVEGRCTPCSSQQNIEIQKSIGWISDHQTELGENLNFKSFEGTDYRCPTVRHFYNGDESAGVALAVAEGENPGRIALFPGVFGDSCQLMNTIVHENLHVHGGGPHLSRSNDGSDLDLIDQAGLEAQRLCEEEREKHKLEVAIQVWRKSLAQ
jgi:hypothetical protein